MTPHDRLREAREQSGYTRDEIAKELAMTFGWVTDMETEPEHVSYVVLPDLFRLCDMCRLTPLQLFEDCSKERTGCVGSAQRLVGALRSRLDEVDQPLEEVEDQLGWYLSDVLRDPQTVYGRTTNFLRDISTYVGWDWLGCLQQWFEHWQQTQEKPGIGPSDSEGAPPQV